ncbi:MAG: hypothetical protein H6818_09520 [Phycisphaerales bacterium]|nr:hypothetical protein [Phycisphaerales bacterium]MCB9864108.1 hypothetical protein [Phycisphaerales bacterium]
MATEPRNDNEKEVGEISSLTVLLGRLTWMVIGPAALVYVIYSIVSSGDGWFTPWDFAFVIIAALMIGGRWIEQRSGGAMTVMGHRSTSEHFARYVRILLPAAIGAWIVANVVGNHLLT